MKRIFLIALFLVAATKAAAQIVVPDGDLSGVAETQTITGNAGVISGLSVGIILSGTGFGAVNGDLYAYLTHAGKSVVLLNRPGRRVESSMGYDDNGMNFLIFNDSAPNDIHNYRLALSGDHSVASPFSTIEWQPDGRSISPELVLDTSPRTTFLSDFNGMNPNGEWTLFVADLETGGTAIFDGFALLISTSPVPEPQTYALWTGGILLAGAMARRFMKKATPQGRF